jgi:hypothetical protein
MSSLLVVFQLTRRAGEHLPTAKRTEPPDDGPRVQADTDVASCWRDEKKKTSIFTSQYRVSDELTNRFLYFSEKQATS